jgi:hypothetical protein
MGTGREIPREYATVGPRKVPQSSLDGELHGVPARGYFGARNTCFKRCNRKSNTVEAATSRASMSFARRPELVLQVGYIYPASNCQPCSLKVMRAAAPKSARA